MRATVRRPWAVGTAVATLVSLLAGCSLSSSSEDTGAAKDKTVGGATHDSWAMSKSVLAEFTRKTGYQVKIEPNGDVGQLTNKLVLTKGSPIADMTYGIDNTFASRAVDQGVLAPYTPKALPASAKKYALANPDDAKRL